MLFSLSPIVSVVLLGLAATVQSAGDGYIGYSLREIGDRDTAVYETADTPSNASSATLPPDVYLNASLNVGEIDIEVQNLTAQINVAAQVLSLLKFNAGVEASIDRVSLSIQNVSAKVLLEARLENLVRMIDDVLDSADLNPVLATLGNDLGQIANTTASGLNSTSQSQRRGLDLDLAHNILYSINDYSGNTHTNRVLARNGDIVEQKLDNDGRISRETVIGNYARDMTFNGYDKIVHGPGAAVREREYVYTPIPGISSVSAIFTDAQGAVVATQVLSESRAGGGSTIEGELKQ